MSINIQFTLFGYVGTAVIYVLVNSLVLTFERTQSATLLFGLVCKAKGVSSALFSYFSAPKISLNSFFTRKTIEV